MPKYKLSDRRVAKYKSESTMNALQP